MTILNQETRNIQNPALGAMLLWRFTTGYAKGSKASSPIPLPLLFIVLPIMLHQETAQFITSTQQRSGLRTFAAKFAEPQTSKNDLLLAIHERSIKMRNLSMNSLRQAIASKLILIDSTEGVAISISKTQPKAGIPKSVGSMIRGAEKLGSWCSELTLHEVSVILKVRF